MLFPSEVFLFVFFPVVLVVYYAFLRKTKTLKNIFLLLASLFFYAWGEPIYVFLMIGTILANWFFGILVDSFRDKKTLVRLILALMVLANIGTLGWFKYSAFTVLQINRFLHTSIPVPDVPLPIGISFYTFQAMSYVIDVYRQRGKVQKNPLQVGLYIALFPQLIAGPIVRYETIAEQIVYRVENLQDFTAGVTRFCIGLGKKVLVANNMAVIADNAFGLIINGEFQASAGMAWLGAIAYTLQIFFDFSGYSDMAIGLGQMFGFHFEENFNYPYISKTVSEFWRRWHISMQTWFRDYVYFPLGGSRVSKPRLIVNIFVVWLLTGMWHGANWTFIAWGLMYFVILTFEKLTGFGKKEHWWGHIYTMVLVIIGWVIFRSTGMGNAFLYIKAMFGIGAKGIIDKAVWAYIAQNWIYFVFAIIGCAPILPWIDQKLKDSRIWQAVYAVGVVVCLVVSVSFICNNAYNPFIYFNF
ncbi:MAG: MBOAT family protein [Lachnospiraceae bacterium]|nr:MBOAT family protein [Lachnospiraceae bacterium]